jgi:hypothetical protein
MHIPVFCFSISLFCSFYLALFMKNSVCERLQDEKEIPVQ